jgi:hypothetical protein
MLNITKVPTRFNSLEPKQNVMSHFQRGLFSSRHYSSAFIRRETFQRGAKVRAQHFLFIMKSYFCISQCEIMLRRLVSSVNYFSNESEMQRENLYLGKEKYMHNF